MDSQKDDIKPLEALVRSPSRNHESTPLVERSHSGHRITGPSIHLQGRTSFAHYPRLRDSLELMYPTVIKVFTVHSPPSFSQPWQHNKQIESTGSGFILDVQKRHIVTNHHVVVWNTQVLVKLRGADRRFVARVLVASRECDIALLTVDKDEFWESSQQVTLGDLPELQDEVGVIGYPTGGDTLSITAGVVSRIELRDYSTFATTKLLCVQIDAAINPGNSGGPVFNHQGKCIGIAFQKLSQQAVEGVGYIIPIPMLTHFLNDYVKNGAKMWFPECPFSFQTMESETLQKWCQMRQGQQGVLVQNVDMGTPATQVLHVGDVVQSINGVQVSSDGTIPFRTGERISCTWLVSQLYLNDSVVVEVLRGGMEMQVSFSLQPGYQLVPEYPTTKDPQYIAFAGLIFSAMTQAMVADMYEEGLYLQAYYLMKAIQDELEGQVVVLLATLPSEISLGYNLGTAILQSVNNAPVKDIVELIMKIIECEDEYIKFQFVCFSEDCKYSNVVYETLKAKELTPSILRSYAIPHALSVDLRAHVEKVLGKKNEKLSWLQPSEDVEMSTEEDA